MGRTKKSVRSIGRHTEDDMLKAIKLVLDGETIRKTAKLTNIPYPTLRRYVEKYKINKFTNLTPKYEVNAVFTPNQENVLKQYILECANLFYGLSAKEVRRVAYQTAAINNLKMPESWKENKIAGKEWLRSFRNRHPELTLKKPEVCSLARASAFNKTNVQTFFNKLKEAMQRCPDFGNGTRVYNLDETSTTTVQRPQKVLALKGSNVCKVTSGERGVLVTTCCIISAAGVALPPVLVFPRKKYQPHMINGAPPGTLGLATPSGWMNSEIFVEVIRHFIKNTAASKDNPALMILDNHESHLSLEALDLAKSNGVTILTLPPHTTGRLQPLDVGLNGPFKTYYNSAVDSWLLRNPGHALTIYQVAECVGQAYLKAMTPVNITNAFRKCGILPYNEDVFSEQDFLPSSVSDRPEPDIRNDNIKPELNENENPNHETDVETDLEEDPVSPSILIDSSSQQIQNPDSTLRNCDQLSNEKISSPEVRRMFSSNQTLKQMSPKPSTSKEMDSFVSPKVFRPPLKAGPRKIKRRRILGRSMIATDTPEKQIIAEKKLKGVKKVKKADLFTQKRKPVNAKIDSEDEDSVHESFHASGSSSGGDQFLSDSEDDEIILDDDFSPLPRNPNVGDYVIVMLKTQKKNNKCYYVAKILEISDEPDYDYFVSYLKLKSKVQYKFAEPIEPDLAGVSATDIKYILPNPKVQGSRRRKATYKFPVNLSNLRFPF